MNAAKQAAWLFGILILLACSGWYFASSPDAVYKLDDKTLSTTADTLIYDLTVRQFNEQGQLTNQLETPLMEHIPLNNTHFLQKPRIIISQQNQPPWAIQSERAVALKGGEEITFIKNVVIHNKDKNGQDSTMRTEQMVYYPSAKKATSSMLVTFEQPGTVVKAIGMNAYLDEKRVELLNKARGSYVPSRG